MPPTSIRAAFGLGPRCTTRVLCQDATTVAGLRCHGRIDAAGAAGPRDSTPPPWNSHQRRRLSVVACSLAPSIRGEGSYGPAALISPTGLRGFITRVEHSADLALRRDQGPLRSDSR
jgi:hypothetical protein